MVCSIGENDELRRILEFAKQGIHILSRREILKYITADSNTRAQEIQELLNITEIEETRKTLVKIKHDCQRELDNANSAVSRAESQVNVTVQQKIFDKKSILEAVNQNRSILGADTISDLHSTNLKKGVRPPVVISQNEGFNVTLFDRDIQNLQNTISDENVAIIEENDKKLRKLIENICTNPDIMRTLKQQDLIKLGISMIDETGRCPLCDTAWPSGKLLEYLKGRAATAKIAGEYQKEVGQLVNVINTSVNNTIASLRKVIVDGKATELSNDLSILKSWLEDLQKFSAILGSVVENYMKTGWNTSEIKRMLAPANIAEVLSNIKKGMKEKFPESTPEQTAWDTLTRLEENLGSMENAAIDVKKALLYVKRSVLLHDHFLLARDKVLGQLYEAIKDRFVGLYRDIHADDESKFVQK